MICTSGNAGKTLYFSIFVVGIVTVVDVYEVLLIKLALFFSIVIYSYDYSSYLVEFLIHCKKSRIWECITCNSSYSCHLAWFYLKLNLATLLILFVCDELFGFAWPNHCYNILSSFIRSYSNSAAKSVSVSLIFTGLSLCLAILEF